MQPYSFTMSWSSVINRISHIIDTSINNQKTRGKIMFLEVGVQKKLGKEAWKKEKEAWKKEKEAWKRIEGGLEKEQICT